MMTVGAYASDDQGVPLVPRLVPAERGIYSPPHPDGKPISRIDATTSTGAIYCYEVLIGIRSSCGMQAALAVIKAITKPDLVTSGLSFIVIGRERPYLPSP